MQPDSGHYRVRDRGMVECSTNFTDTRLEMHEFFAGRPVEVRFHPCPSIVVWTEAIGKVSLIALGLSPDTQLVRWAVRAHESIAAA